MSEWPEVALLEAVTDASSGNAKTKQGDYLNSGLLPVVDQGKAVIGGYTDNLHAAFSGDLPAIVFGDHTGIVKYVDFRFGMGADGVKVLVPQHGWDVRFLFHYIKAIQLPDVGYSRHFKFLKRARVPKPSLDEQRRIADILDQADALRAKRRETLSLLDDLTQSVFLDMFGEPRRYEGDVASLTTLCRLYSGATPSKKSTEFWKGHLPWFSPKDLKRPYLGISKDHVSEAVLEQTTLRLLDAPTVAIVVRGMILARAVPVSLLTVPATINQDLKAVLPRENVDPIFLLWAIRSQEAQVLSAVSTAAHGTKRLDKDALAAISVPRPGLQLERAFAARAEKIRHTRDGCQASLTELDSLFASLQQRAFSGQL